MLTVGSWVNRRQIGGVSRFATSGPGRSGGCCIAAGRSEGCCCMATLDSGCSGGCCIATLDGGGLGGCCIAILGAVRSGGRCAFTLDAGGLGTGCATAGGLPDSTSGGAGGCFSPAATKCTDSDPCDDIVRRSRRKLTSRVSGV